MAQVGSAVYSSALDRVVGEARLLGDRGSRIREVVEAPDGALYLLTDESDGKVLKLTPKT